jgi:hypothetical protein
MFQTLFVITQLQLISYIYLTKIREIWVTQFSSGHYNRFCMNQQTLLMYVVLNGMAKQVLYTLFLPWPARSLHIKAS